MEVRWRKLCTEQELHQLQVPYRSSIQPLQKRTRCLAIPHGIDEWYRKRWAGEIVISKKRRTYQRSASSTRATFQMWSETSGQHGCSQAGRLPAKTPSWFAPQSSKHAFHASYLASHSSCQVGRDRPSPRFTWTSQTPFDHPSRVPVDSLKFLQDPNSSKSCCQGLLPGHQAPLDNSIVHHSITTTGSGSWSHLPTYLQTWPWRWSFLHFGG